MSHTPVAETEGDYDHYRIIDMPYYQSKMLVGRQMKWGEIGSLGRHNLATLISNAEWVARKTGCRIGEIRWKRSLLQGKSAADFAEIASRYRKAGINNRSGATTLGVCGGCKYALDMGDDGRSSTPYVFCGLLHKRPEVSSRKTCLLQDMAAADFSFEVKQLDRRERVLRVSLESLKEEIGQLRACKRGVAKKPYLAPLRPSQKYCGVGDEVVVYKRPYWVPGEVSRVIKQVWWKKCSLLVITLKQDAEKLDVPTYDPRVMTQKDFAYLQAARESDPAFLSMWVGCATNFLNLRPKKSE